MQVPFTVKALPPVAKLPLAEMVPETVKGAPNVAAVLEFIVKLFKPPEIAGRVKFPVVVMLEFDPPVSVPLDVEIAFTDKVFEPIDSAPLVSVNVPAIVWLLPKLTPPAPFMVKLLILPENTDEGKVMAEAFVNATTALALLASIYPEVLKRFDPDNVRVFAPSVRFPLVNVKVPGIIKFPPSETPPDPLSVKFRTLLLLKRLAGKVTGLVLVNST